MKDSNRVCDKLGIAYPLVQAAMNWITDATMVAAVSNAGGMGVLGPNAGQKQVVADPTEVAERMRGEIRRTNELTDKPFAVNLILPNERSGQADVFAQAILKVVFEEGVKNIVTIGEVNESIFENIKNQGCVLIHREYNPSSEAAKRAEKTGADLLIATGYDEGGVVPQRPIGTFSIVPTIADAVDIPVLAAGGINDIRGVRAAFALGAEGVYIGSRFIVSKECPASDITKQEIVRAKGTDLLSLKPYRSTPNEAARELWELCKNGMAPEALDEKIRERGGLRPGMLEGNMDAGIVSVNTAIDLIKEVKGCEEIVKELMADYR